MFPLIAAAIAPSLAIILYIFIKDKYDKEPIKYLAICFLLGALGIIPAIFIEMYLENHYSIGDKIGLIALSAFFGVALPEELVKFIALRYYIFKKSAFNEPYDGIVYAVMISMGFATIENLFYVIDSGGGMHTALLRMFTAVPAHAIFGITMGYFVGKAKFESWNRASLLTQGFLLSFILHGAYDFFIFQNTYANLGILSFIGVCLGIYYCKKAINIQVENSPFKNQPPNLSNDLSIEKEDLLSDNIGSKTPDN